MNEPADFNELRRHFSYSIRALGRFAKAAEGVPLDAANRARIAWLLDRLRGRAEWVREVVEAECPNEIDFDS